MELCFFANNLVLIVLLDYKIKIGGHVQEYFLIFFLTDHIFSRGPRGAPPPKKNVPIFAPKASTYIVRKSHEKNVILLSAE